MIIIIVTSTIMIILTALVIQAIIELMFVKYDVNHLKLAVAFFVIIMMSDIVILHVTIKNRKEIFAKD